LKNKFNKNFLSFLNQTNISYEKIYKIKSDASKRIYYRCINKKKSLLIMDASKEKKSLKSFVKISNWLSYKGYSTPKVYEKNYTSGYCILEDFGDSKFSNLPNAELRTKYKPTIKLLNSFSKIKPPDDLKFFSRPIFNKELNLFINWFFLNNKKKMNFNLSEWNEIWNKLFVKVNNNKNISIVLRDFHIDNLFWLANRNNLKKIGLIDFQDALVGHPCYDLVSLLQDVRIDISKKNHDILYNYYLRIGNQNDKVFEDAYYIFGTQRLIKIIGVFYRLKYFYKNSYYMKFIPRTWLLLRRNLKHPTLYELSSWFKYNVFK